MQHTHAELVRAHTRALSLLALQNVLAASGDAAVQLRAIGAEQFETAFVDPAFRSWVTEVLLGLAEMDPTRPLQLIGSALPPIDGVTVLPVTASLQRIAGPKMNTLLVTDPSVVRTAWSRARGVLEQVRHFELMSAFQAVDLIAGFHGPHGEIRALSNPQFPGFVAIGVDNPPLILAEQALHEAVHVSFAACLALLPELSELTEDQVGVLSPFTNSVRTVERVAHGIVSYGAVRELWRAASAEASLPSWMEFKDAGRASEIAARRIRTLDARLSVALRALVDAAGMDICRILGELAMRQFGVELNLPQISARLQSETVQAAGYPSEAEGLTPIQRAELQLAVHGQKVSRITIPMADLPLVGFALLASTSVVPSNWVVRPVPDPVLGNFSNLSGETEHVTDADPSSEVHLYLHKDPDLARQAALLDLEDQAGELLGIPSCCLDWFSRAWPKARAGGGDAFAMMIREAANEGHISVAAECDTSAMYRGGGLCWHFPCSPCCQSTIDVVRSRREFLRSCDPKLLAELDVSREYFIQLVDDGSYIRGKTKNLHSIKIQFIE